MTRRLLVLFVAVVLTAVPVEAQEIAATQVFPVVARTAGGGVPPTQWVTDLAINNVMGSSITVGIQFFPAEQANTLDQSFPNRVSLSVRETVIIEDVLKTTFGYTQDVKGILLVTCDPDLMWSSGNSPNARITATTRTYNISDPDGTFGQTVPSLKPMANGYTQQAFVTGARNDNRFRSNLGIANLSLETVRVHYRFMWGKAQILKEGSESIPALSLKQWSFKSLGVGKVQGAITVDLWLDPGDVASNPCAVDWPNMFMAYVSKVDGNYAGTGDAEFLYAAPSRMMDCDNDLWD